VLRWRKLKLSLFTIIFFIQEDSMRKINILAAASVAFGAQLLLLTPSAEAAGCGPAYASCQQTCRDNSVGGKNFGVGLWDASRSKACFQGCSSERTQCNIAALKRESMTTKRPL
jgi:hypothetical protein